mmetsp:Transcript_17514/g.29512  ORF Transcript_17514/g.29512 Transcript_17514/m.29512 type:complete len:161 (-) Transcript_17514:687-1169(-)
MSQLLNYVIGAKSSERVSREFSLKEFSICFGAFRGVFKQQLNKPTSENNKLINLEIKIQNFIIMAHTGNQILSGLFTYSVKRFFGEAIDTQAFNRLGEKRGYYVQMAFYLFIFFFSISRLGSQRIYDVNHFMDPRDDATFNFLQVVMQVYPNKVDQAKVA